VSDNLKHRLEIAKAAAWEAGKATLRHFQTSPAIEWKADRSPVTAADRESEGILLSILRREFPGDAFLGEEGGERPGTTGFRWIVDPLDGTKSFVQGVPLYGVMIGLEDPKGEVVAGAISFPALGDLVAAARGEGAAWNGRASRVSGVADLKDACVCFGSARAFQETGNAAAFERIVAGSRITRGWGDCYGHVLVATGRAEAMLDPVIEVWDAAALLPILEEAGGAFTDWKGRRTVRGRSGISTNGRVDRSLRALLDGPIGHVGDLPMPENP
jgi:histidinol phosphatase-like enzyme (inositol monophosphatase family)